MEAILDTNFIISCVMKKIDFIEQLKELGFTPILPREVFQELKDLQLKNKTSHDERTAIDVAFQLFESAKVKKTKLGGASVDDGLIKKGKEGIHIATLDNGIKMRVPNKIVIQNAQKRVAVERS